MSVLLNRALASARPLLPFESLVAQFWSGVLQAPCQAVVHVEPFPITEARRWVFFREREPFAVALPGAEEQGWGRWFAEYVDALQRFERYRGKRSACQVTAPQDLAGWVEHSIQIHHGGERIISYLGLQARERQGEEDGLSCISEACPEVRARVRRRIRLLLREALPRAGRSAIPASGEQLLQVGESVFQAHTQFTNWEVSMSIQAEHDLAGESSSIVGAVLELGSIELRLEDALSLRPGTRLVVPLPTHFQAALRIDDVRWASVRVELVGEHVHLTVSETTIREATFSEIPREES